MLSSLPQNVNYVRPFAYAPVFAPKRKNSVTLNFPTSATAYKADSRSGKSIQSLERLGDEGYVFTYDSKGMALSYRIHPKTGMPSVEVVVNDY